MTTEESKRADDMVREQLFVWCSPNFVGYYTMVLLPGVATNSQKFIQYKTWMQQKFSTQKSHFLWRYAYKWVVDAASANRQLVFWAEDDNPFTSQESTGKLNAWILDNLNARSFKEIFHHVRHLVDFEGTKAYKNGENHGYFFIKSMALSLITALLHLWAIEKNMNAGPDGHVNTNILLKKEWTKDLNTRDRIQHDFTGWGCQDIFKSVNWRSFKKIEVSLAPAKPAVPGLDLAAARQTMVVAVSATLPMPVYEYAD